jgi:hypothetical protein
MIVDVLAVQLGKKEGAKSKEWWESIGVPQPKEEVDDEEQFVFKKGILNIPMIKSTSCYCYVYKHEKADCEIIVFEELDLAVKYTEETFNKLNELLNDSEEKNT